MTTHATEQRTTLDGRHVGVLSDLCEQHASYVGAEAAIIVDMHPTDLLSLRQVQRSVERYRGQCRTECGRASS